MRRRPTREIRDSVSEMWTRARPFSLTSIRL
jgi:hypothetical protein